MLVVSEDADVASGDPVSEEAADVLLEVFAMLDIPGVVKDKRSLTLVAVWVDADNPGHHPGEQTSHQHDGGHDGVHLDGEEYGESRPSSSSHCACL